jgi:MoaA/NifB/PqqE/SkfB family radical SAM enzyme
MTYVQTRKPHEFNLWRDKRPLLGQLDIELTERCNNACLHCLINQPEHNATARAREMDTAFVKDILRQAAGLGCLTIRFTGGEPLLRDDFAELYLFARRLGLHVILFTNARRITPELAQLLARIPPGRLVEVTVYGMHAASYEAAAVAPGAFAEFWRGIELLRAYKIPFAVKQSVLPPNRHEIAEFEAFAVTLPRVDQLLSYAMNFDLRARRDNPAKNRFIQTLRLTPDETVALLARDPNYIKSMREFCDKFMGPPGDKLFSCGAGHGICVDAYGHVQMCMLLRNPATVYDLRDGVGAVPRACPDVDDHTTGAHKGSPLQYALAEFFPRLREMRATNPEYLRRCARCFLKGLCEQCPAKSWTENGTLDTPVEYLCEVAHAQARYLGLLGADERAWEVREWRERIAQFAAVAGPRDSA